MSHWSRLLKGSVKKKCKVILTISLGISTNLEAVTAQYVDVRLERKKAVLSTYHKSLQPQKSASEKEPEQKNTPAKPKKKSNKMEL